MVRIVKVVIEIKINKEKYRKGKNIYNIFGYNINLRFNLIIV